MKIRVLETSDFSDSVKARLSMIGDLTFLDKRENESLDQIFKKYDIIWFRLGYEISTNTINFSEAKAKYLVTPVTGLNHIDLDKCKEFDITVISLKNEFDFLKNIRATAEHTILLTLSILRKINSASASVLNKKWNRENFRGNEIYNKTVGIIGFGRLGSIVSDYFSALGARIIYYDDNLKKTTSNKYKYVALDELLKKSDIISLHIDYSKKNLNFINKSHFDLMKNSAVFINTSRGELINGSDLVYSLKNNKILGAAIDVISDEFNYKNSPEIIYYSTNPNNLIITPHIGGNTYESFEKTEEFILAKLEKIIS